LNDGAEESSMNDSTTLYLVYEAPTLTVLGTIEALTRGTAGPGFDEGGHACKTVCLSPGPH
jgi:hypothetical protein